MFRLGGSDAFWKFSDLAFANPKELTTENFQKWAGQVGVDVAKFKAAFDKQEYAAKIDQDMALAKQLGASGTPAFFINGVFLSGAQPIDKFKSIIDEQLAAAQKLTAAGTKADQVYVKLANENKAKAPAPSKPREEQQDDKTVWKIPVGNSPVKGSANAPVTLVIFSEFQCPFCKKVLPTFDELSKAYGDKLRVVWKDLPLPFHPRAVPTAKLAREAMAQKGMKGFWAAHDALFESQPKLEDSDLLEVAKKLGLDVAKVEEALKSDKYKAAIDADAALAEDFNATGTPHMFINGRRLVGAQPVDKFKAVIDEELKKAEALLAKGTPPGKIYEEIIKDGKEPPPPERKTVSDPPADAPWKGGAKAKVTIQVFSDFECPFCKRVEPTLDQVMKTYGDKVKLVWRHKPLPMHKNAPLASEASQEVWKQKGNDAFWKYHDKLFATQGTPEAFTRPSLEKVAEELGGLDMAKFKKALDANTHKAFVDAESAAADKAGISGTPAFVINGYFLSGAQGFGKFKKLIDLALKEAGG